MAGGDRETTGYTSCRCVTEQGTRYLMDMDQCVRVAVDGQYEPLYDEAQGDVRRMDDVQQLKRLDEAELQRQASAPLGSEDVVGPAGAALVDPLLGGSR